jgi:hypothetical protein
MAGMSKRSSFPAPYVATDTMDPVEQVDGKFYTSKRTFRAVGRQLGLTEVGTAKVKPKTYTPLSKDKRRDDLKRVIAQYKEGRRPRMDKTPPE